MYCSSLMQWVHGLNYLVLTKLTLKKGDRCLKTKKKPTVLWKIMIESISEKQENSKTDTYTPNMSFSSVPFKSKSDDYPTEFMKSQPPPKNSLKLKNCSEDWLKYKLKYNQHRCWISLKDRVSLGLLAIVSIKSSWLTRLNNQNIT